MKVSGIYMIQSISKPERVYIGSALDFKHRWSRHISDLGRGVHHSHKLQRHYNKYGVNDLEFSVLESGDYFNKNHLLAREQGWYIPYSFRGDNKPYFNELAIAGSSIGKIVSKETGDKISKSNKGREVWNKGKKMSKEYCEIMGKAHTGIRQSEKANQKRKSTWLIKSKKPSEQKNYRLGGKSPYLGVWLDGSRIRAVISIGGSRRLRLGSFKTEEDAARAYDKKAKELFGEFAKLNFK